MTKFYRSSESGSSEELVLTPRATDEQVEAAAKAYDAAYQKDHLSRLRAALAAAQAVAPKYNVIVNDLRGREDGFAAGVEAAAETAVHILREWGERGTIHRIDEHALKDLLMDVQQRALRPPAAQAESEVTPPIVKERCSRCGVVLGDMDKAMAETNRLWRAINGMDIDDADKRAEALMHSTLDGLTIGPENRATVKSILAEHFADLMRPPLSASEPAGAKQPQYDCWDEGFPRSAEPAGAPIHSAAVEAAAEQLWEAMLPRRTMQWCISTAKIMLTTAQRNEPAGAPSEEDVARALEDADRRASQRISRDYWNYLARSVLALLQRGRP